MTIYRFPVPSRPKAIPPVLPCKDFERDTNGPRTGETCRGLYLESRTKKFVCPRRKDNEPGRCALASFLYPRGWRKKGEDENKGFVHFHQGVDMAGGAFGEPVVSVTGGKVTFATDEHYKRGSGGYGRMVAVHDKDGTGYTFLYAHLAKGVLVKEGDRVKPGQVIGLVGNSSTGRKDGKEDGERIIIDHDRSGAHLHFEVANKTHRYDRTIPETQLVNWPGGDTPRLDPLAVLEQLGPYESTDGFLPTGDKIDPKRAKNIVEAYHQQVEFARHGGFFPLGANNVWHGGVHLPAPPTPLVAPFDAEIVALRLHPEPECPEEFGSTNFMLLRHEISETAFALLQRENEDDPPTPPPTVRPTAKSGVGLGGTNPKVWVLYVKDKLHELGYYRVGKDQLQNAENVEKDEVFIAAIKAFQEDTKKKGSKWRPDGLIEIPGRPATSWAKLHGGDNVSPPKLDEDDDDDGGGGDDDDATTDPKRTIYSLLMHLAKISIDEDDDKIAEKIPWLARVKLEPNPGQPSPSDDAKAKKKTELEDDQKEIDSLAQLSASIGNGKPNRPEDVKWVQLRLNRLVSARLPTDGIHSVPVDQAVRSFQKEHVPFYRDRVADGIITPGKGTWKELRKTKQQRSDEGGPAIDPVFVQRVQEMDEHDAGKILSGLSIKVRAGENLWYANEGLGTSDDHAVDPPRFHWEIFSEHELLPSWEQKIDDPNHDLTIDAPQLIEQVDQINFFSGFRKDGILSPLEIRAFYQSGKGKFLRRTKCRFHSEWAMDLDAAIPRLAEKKFSNAENLRKSVPPYLWWDHASDVLPPTDHVWHYNPIEFMRVYAEALGHLKPPPPPPPVDPTKFSTVRVNVFDVDGNPAQGFDVVIDIEGGFTLFKKATSFAGEGDPGGVAIFAGVPIGTYSVRVEKSARAPIPLAAMPEQLHQVDIRIELKGPPPPNGQLTVRTVDNSRSPINGVTVSVLQSGRLAVPAAKSRTEKKKGEAVFAELPFGTYTIRGRLEDEDIDTEDHEFLLAKKEDVVSIKLNPPWGKLLVKAKYAVTGRPAPGQPVAIRKASDEGIVAQGVTDANGEASFRLRIGLHHIALGDPALKKQAWINKTKKDAGGNESAPQVRTFEVAQAMRPTSVVVIVLGASDGVRVRLRHKGSTVHQGKTNSQGTILFEDVIPGVYVIVADGAGSLEVDVVEGARSPFTLSAGT
jgi:hypothetical protein